jgi:hypothetical protein
LPQHARHARRKFDESIKTGSSQVAQEAIRRFALIYHADGISPSCTVQAVIDRLARGAPSAACRRSSRNHSRRFLPQRRRHLRAGVKALLVMLDGAHAPYKTAL